jgi:SAM-dependent methyltransferase
MKQVEIPTIKAELKALILDALKRAYVSSGKDGIETGNHYQSVVLGNERTSGFRSDRAEFLDQINFEGKRVLDLGSNLGELSRAARARGAALVDGYEYDSYFVELARLLNAYNGTTCVSFHQCDITDSGSYRERYDLVLAFSVFTYISGVLERLTAMTDEALVVETHRLDGNLEPGYLAPIRRYLPAYEILGESDWGRSLPEHQTRAVIVFARNRRALDRALDRGSPDRVKVDVQKTALQKLFFASAQHSDGEQLIAEVQKMDIDLARAARNPDLDRELYSGRLYWMIFLKGYAQYCERRLLGPGNIYFDYITDYYAPSGHDPALCEALRDPLFAMERVASRFKDLDQFRRCPRDYRPATPIVIYQSGDPDTDNLVLYEAGTEKPIQAYAVDGWHRLFAARIFGATSIPADVLDPPAT